MGRDPRTPSEWQDAVDLAYALLVLDSARQYGLVTGGPTVRVHRAEDLLSRGKEKGIEPRTDAATRLLPGLI